jgi:hypothetical protein
LRQAGFRVSDIRRIVLTHAHEDHCGLARSLRDEAKNAQILVHEWETGHRHSRLEYDEHRALLVRAGVPDDEILRMRRMYEGVRQYADSLADHEHSPLADDAEVEFESGSLRIVHNARSHSRLLFICSRSRSNHHRRRLCPEAHYSKSGPVARPHQSIEAFSIAAEYLVSLARLRTFAQRLFTAVTANP